MPERTLLKEISQLRRITPFSSFTSTKLLKIQNWSPILKKLRQSASYLRASRMIFQKLSKLGDKDSSTVFVQTTSETASWFSSPTEKNTWRKSKRKAVAEVITKVSREMVITLSRSRFSCVGQKSTSVALTTRCRPPEFTTSSTSSRRGLTRELTSAILRLSSWAFCSLKIFLALRNGLWKVNEIIS
jgi:hypothetical protein